MASAPRLVFDTAARRFMGSGHDFRIAHRAHEPSDRNAAFRRQGVGSSELLPAKAGVPNQRFMGSLIFALAATALLSSAGVAAPTADYERDIKPIFHERCYVCHSRLKQKAGLRLDAGALIHKGGKDGAVVIPGNSSESALLKRVLETDESERMPPEGKRLTVDQV